MKYRVSVIVPVYNCEKYLTRALNSVVLQKDFFLDELILVDDGSVDGSGKICDVYQSEYPNVKVIHQQNSGVSIARNEGIKKAEGEWIFFLDSDDYILNGAFSRMLEYSQSDIICGKHISNIDGNKNFDIFFDEGVYRTDEIKESLNNALINTQIFYTCWSRLYKKSIVDEFQIEFPANVKFAEDMVFVYEYLKHCNSIAFTKENVYYYYVNTENTTSVVPKSFDVFLYIYNWQKSYFEEAGVLTDSLKNQLVSVFAYNAFVSLKIAAESLPFFDSVKYISYILNNALFKDLYFKSNMSFSYKLDVLLDGYIKKNNPLLIVLSVRFYCFKSRVYRLLKGDKND